MSHDSLCPRAFLPVLAVVLTLGLILAAPPALAAGGGGGSTPAEDAHGGGGGDGHGGGQPNKEALPPRTKADTVGGDYIQLHTLWLPVLQGRRSRYEAFTVRLAPNPDKLVPACLKAPWAHEAVLMALNEQPVTVEDMTHLDAKALRDRLVARIATQVEPNLFTDVMVLSGILDAEPTSATLSEMCR